LLAVLQRSLKLFEILPHLRKLGWVNHEPKLPCDYIELNFSRSGKETHKGLHLVSCILDRSSRLGESLNALSVAQPKSSDNVFDPVTSCAKRSLKVPRSMGLKCGRRDTGKVGRKRRWSRAIIQHEGSVASQCADKEARLEYDIVACYSALRSSGDGEIIGCEHEDSKVESTQGEHQGFERTLRQAECPLAPNLNLT